MKFAPMILHPTVVNGFWRAVDGMVNERNASAALINIVCQTECFDVLGVLAGGGDPFPPTPFTFVVTALAPYFVFRPS